MKWNEIFQIFELTERLILSDIILLTSHNCGPVQDIFLVMCRLHWSPVLGIAAWVIHK